jgi:hypothetical protein
VATGGSTTTVVDSGLASWGWADDAFNLGTAFFIRDVSAGAGAGVTRVVSDFVASTGTATVATLTTAFASGDIYGLMTSRYPRQVLMGGVNAALADMGEVVSTFDIAADGSREYALASTYDRIHSIHIGEATADPQEWDEAFTYRHMEGRLLFDQDIDDGKTIRVAYLAAHPILTADTDAINASINHDWLGLAAAVNAARWRLNQAGADDKAQTILLNDLLVREQAARFRRRVWRPMPAHNIFPVGLPER